MTAPDGSWFWVVEPGEAADAASVVVAGDGRRLSRRAHGTRLRAEISDESGLGLPIATSLRALAAAEVLGVPRLRIRLAPRGTAARFSDGELVLDGALVAEAGTRHPLEALVRELAPPRVSRGRSLPLADANAAVHATGSTPNDVNPGAAASLTPGPAVRRVLFFESLMNTDMPHNDTELSQGVLHMASALRGLGSEVVLANVKMSITDRSAEIVGLGTLGDALAAGPVELVCITLLEGYFDGVVRLIEELRRLGCRAHVAVGGVMATLAPEHVAAHLGDISFVCRGAGEYFVPHLARLLGPGAGVDQPFSSEQRAALLELEGIIALDRAGRRVISAVSAASVKVEALDDVALDLGLITARHLENGVEISTARGCIHKCTFCSILGRQSYQARSSAGILRLLGEYDAHYRALFAGNVPRNAYRLHISDDDFACDRERAASFLRALLETPFRLSSIQASVADLCRRQDGELVPEPDPGLLAALVPACFADAEAPIPARDFVRDHRSRRWSSFLAIGVETFSEAELRRLGKGYRLAHVRAIVRELARRRIHMDAYFIASNAETAAGDLIDSVSEVCRLKLRHARYFHVRFPIVPRLVSYFTSASYRRLLRNGRTGVQRVARVARVQNHPEFDYPFVREDVSDDPLVELAVERGFFSDERRYTASLDALRRLFAERHAQSDDAAERARLERLVRRLDDLPRRLVFEALAEVRDAVRRDPSRRDEEAEVLASAEEVLGPPERWLASFKRYAQDGAPRLVVIPTWQCELRCSYCWIPKQDGRVMPVATLERAIEMLLASERPRVMLQFFGGEALIEAGLVRHGIEYGTRRAGELGKEISFVLSSNGWSLDETKLAWLARYPVKLELSLDGDPETQNVFRIARDQSSDSYQNGIAPRARAILASGLPYDVIMVVHPKNAGRLAHNFFHVAGLGFERIQINFALGPTWTTQQKTAFADNLREVGDELRRRWSRGERTALINLESAPTPILLNGEITVDWDGTVFGGNGFLHETKHKERFVVGRLDDLASFDRYWLDAPRNDYLLEWSYPPEETKNNLEVGKIFASFITWMRSGVHAPPRATAPVRAEATERTHA
jgi:sulfatase maturation enzyme AslB (radical SAM superfamily)